MMSFCLKQNILSALENFKLCKNSWYGKLQVHMNIYKQIVTIILYLYQYQVYHLCTQGHSAIIIIQDNEHCTVTCKDYLMSIFVILRWRNVIWSGAAQRAEAHRGIYLFFFIFLLFSTEKWGARPSCQKSGGSRPPPRSSIYDSHHMCYWGRGMANKF